MRNMYLVVCLTKYVFLKNHNITDNIIYFDILNFLMLHCRIEWLKGMEINGLLLFDLSYLCTMSLNSNALHC